MKQLVVKLRVLFLCVALVIALILFCSSWKYFSRSNTIAVGGKNFVEQHILSEMLAMLLEEKTDLKVRRKFNLGGTATCFHALISGSIDVYCEYTGTALLNILNEPLIQGPLYPYLKARFFQDYKIDWCPPIGFANRYVLITRKELPVETISDLLIKEDLKLAFDFQFSCRIEKELMKKQYSRCWEGQLMDPAFLYVSLKNSSVDVISGYLTDGQLVDPCYRALIDDQNCLPEYIVAPIVSHNKRVRYPELEAVFNLFGGLISEEEMRYLNYQVDCERNSVEEVARNFLRKKGLLR